MDLPSWIRWPWLLSGLACALMTSAFQNCAQGFRVTELSSLRGNSSFTGPTGNALTEILNFAARYADDDPSLQLGTLDENCLSSSSYDACIFWKNPSATNLLVNGAYLTDTAEDDVHPLSTLAPLQRFGVNVGPRMTGGQLRSSTFNVFYRTGTGTGTRNYYAGQSGSFRTGLTAASAASLNGQRFGVEQVQTFYVLETFREFMAARAGGFFAQGLAVPVNAVSLDVEGNAYYAPASGTTRGGEIELGVRSGKSSRLYPLALNADVAAHESNHANLDAANVGLREADVDFVVAVPCASGGKDYYITTAAAAIASYDAFVTSVERTCGGYDESGIETLFYCNSAAGCLTAIDEGQADFFTMAYYLRAPSIGELGLTEEYVRYWRKRASLNRSNVDSVFGLSFQDDFQKKRVTTSGEIHDMGEIISEILFDVYTDDGTDRDAFLKTVSENLARLNGASTFSTMKDQLIAIDKSAFAGKNGALIRKAFEARGY